MNRLSTLGALVAALLLAACEPTPDPNASTAAATSAAAAQPEPAYVPNPLLDADPPTYLAVLGPCGKVLFEGSTELSAPECLTGIRERAREKGLGELTDAQLADVNIGARWRHEQGKLKQQTAQAPDK
ncbi:hypothetical protein N8I74_12885 [Chitiniphilus purpureus]|uniref:Secreted protein n=1 Tax=Chitiniphilus purpureus TaxID=2981137 RepID=A0ABY6DM86_9NEIS|nr:hypothetical protein [Chitiniphilus sp. CD1]UXY14211.1 hypothetical protein N8I74_12885 [Chitiniphilus sp. CD1]